MSDPNKVGRVLPVAVTFLGGVAMHLARKNQYLRQELQLEQLMGGLNAEWRSELENELLVDHLTKIPNDRALNDRYDALQELGSGTHSMLLFDLDHFKQINDTLGHDGGDDVLKLFAGILSNRSRQSDLPVRLHGEEFGLLLPGVPEVFASYVADNIRRQTEATGEVTVSAGVGELDLSQSLKLNLKQIDEALYAAKNQGRNRVVTVSALPPGN